VSGLLITGVPAIVNVLAFDVPPQGVTTVIEGVPAVAMRAAGTEAVSVVAETNVVVSGLPSQFTVEPETRLVPFTVSVNPGPPAVAQVGLSELIVGTARIVNVCAFEVPPPGVGFTTVMEAVPAAAISDAGTVAVSCVEETNVVAREVPPQRTVEVETKFVPVTVTVNWGPPAVAQAGLIAVVVGTGLLMVNVTAFDVPPPGAGFTTVMDPVPGLAMRAAGTVAVSCVEEPKVVARALPFQ
jgi:hypothetical protein